jgi:hypothetical protein
MSVPFQGQLIATLLLYAPTVQRRDEADVTVNIFMASPSAGLRSTMTEKLLKKFKTETKNIGLNKMFVEIYYTFPFIYVYTVNSRFNVFRI